MVTFPALFPPQRLAPCLRLSPSQMIYESDTSDLGSLYQGKVWPIRLAPPPYSNQPQFTNSHRGKADKLYQPSILRIPSFLIGIVCGQEAPRDTLVTIVANLNQAVESGDAV